MKQKVSPIMLALIAVVVLALLGGVGFTIFKSKGDTGDSSKTIVTIPKDTDDRFKPHLPPNISGGGG